MHMFIELAEYQAAQMGNPKLFWNYRDENFVGWLAKLSLRKGGATEVDTVPKQVLNRFRVYLGNPSMQD